MAPTFVDSAKAGERKKSTEYTVEIDMYDVAF